MHEYTYACYVTNLILTIHASVTKMKGSRNFLLASWLFGFANNISSPLIGLYIYINSSLFYTLNFLLMTSLSLLIGYVIVGYLSNRWRSAITYYRAGISLYILFYITLLLLNKETPKFVDLVSAIYGLAQGFYWFGWDVLFYNTPSKLSFFNRSAYLGFISGILTPGIYGSILTIFENKGYEVLFVLTASLMVFASLMVEDLSVKCELFDIRRSWSVIRLNSNYRYTMTSLALISGVNYILSNLNTILAYDVAKTYFNFMLLNYMLSGVSLVSVFVIRDKLIHKTRPYKIVMIASSVLAVSEALIFISPIIYLIGFNMTSPLIYPIIDVINWNNMDKEYLTLYLVNRQYFLNIGRITASLLEIFLASLTIEEEIIPLLPIVIIASLLFMRIRQSNLD